jgi:uroporphyrinogen decarboxylase
VERLSSGDIVEKLQYVAKAIRLLKTELDGRTALLGFAGSPWTLANFMLDGGSAKEHTKALALFRNDRPLFEALCEKLTDAVITFLRMQISAGVDAVQIFDSHGGLIPLDDFQAASGVWIREIITALAHRVPVIVFSKGTRDWCALAQTGAHVVGVDHEVTLGEARQSLPDDIALQGNLHPARLIHDTPYMIQEETLRMLAEMRARNGYIVNLGHGVPPAARLENIEALVTTVRTSV